MSAVVKRNGKTSKVTSVALGKHRKEVKAHVGSHKICQSFFKRKNTLLEKAREISQVTGADCLLYLKSAGGTEYVYKSPSVEFDLENLRRQEKEEEAATHEDDDTLPGPSFSFSPKKKTSVETQTTESSFSTVSDSTLCRVCGEGRQETKAMWVGCSHVCNLGRVKQTCEYWVHALCIGITVTSKAPLSRIGWKCPFHIASLKTSTSKNKK